MAKNPAGWQEALSMVDRTAEGLVIATNIVAYRDENGSFASRKELKKVPRLGPKAFEAPSSAISFRRMRTSRPEEM